MAGIGFELRKMIDERQGFVAKVRAYACAGLISSGPWLMTILTITLLNLAGPYLGGTEGYTLFRSLVTYAFAFSLIVTGIPQMAVTRRVADLLYAKEYNRVLPAFAAVLIVVGVVHALVGTAFCLWAGFAPLLSFLAVTLFAIIGMTWIALVWLSVVRQYDDVLRAYIYGILVSMVGVVLVFFGRGTTGILAAYTGGQAATLVLLLRTIVRGMESDGGREYGVFKSLINFPMLVGVGLFYNAAIWVDKVIFWFRDGIGPANFPLIRYHPLYDTCSFLAYLTVVPALAINLVQLETAFYERYRAYYGAILAGTPLSVIADKRERMFRSLKEGILRLLRVQGAISVAAIVFAPMIVDVLKLPPAATRIFRLTCLGALFHVLLLINILMLMYFDLRKQALVTSLLFLVLNGGFAWWSVDRGVETYGVGYAMASLLTLLCGFLLLQRSLERLDYHSFTSQPIGSKEERREAEILAAQEAEEEAAEKEAEEETPGEEAPPEPEEVEPEEVEPEQPIIVEAQPEPEPEPDTPDPEIFEETVTGLEAAVREAATAAMEEELAAVEEVVDRTIRTIASEAVTATDPNAQPWPDEGLADETATDLPPEPKRTEKAPDASDETEAE